MIVHERNQGAGAAVVTGYKRALADGFDVVCVMNADNQMDPEELVSLATPVALDQVDYAKANRLFTGEAWNLIPHYRYLGNAFLSLFTKIASGYWHIADSQAGYTAINRRMLELLDLDNVYPRYGYPMDMLRAPERLVGARARCFLSSDLRHRRAVGHPPPLGDRISWLLLKGFFWRMGHRYVIRDFHPLVFFYTAGFFSGLIGIGLASYAIGQHFSNNPPNAGTAILVALMLQRFSVLFTLFAMWFDMETTRDTH